MTTYTEPMRPFEALLSEAPGTLSREKVTIITGAGVLPAGTVLGKQTAADTNGVAAAYATNTGNGTMGTVTVTTAAAGVYNLIITEPGTNVGNFIVEDPNGVIIGQGDVAAAFSAGGLAFTLADGGTDFVAGDGFTITVATGTGKYEGYDDALATGAEVACAVLMEAVDATSADVDATAIVRLAEVKKDQLQWITAVDSTAKAKAYVDLLKVNIKAL